MSTTRVVIYTRTTEEGETVEAFSSVKALLSVHEVAPYNTLMNHLSRHGRPYEKNGHKVHRRPSTRARLPSRQ